MLEINEEKLKEIISDEDFVKYLGLAYGSGVKSYTGVFEAFYNNPTKQGFIDKISTSIDSYFNRITKTAVVASNIKIGETKGFSYSARRKVILFIILEEYELYSMEKDAQALKANQGTIVEYDSANPIMLDQSLEEVFSNISFINNLGDLYSPSQKPYKDIFKAFYECQNQNKFAERVSNRWGSYFQYINKTARIRLGIYNSEAKLYAEKRAHVLYIIYREYQLYESKSISLTESDRSTQTDGGKSIEAILDEKREIYSSIRKLMIKLEVLDNLEKKHRPRLQ